MRGAVSSVVPNETKAKGGGEYVGNYIEHYNCKPPPLFMILVSLVEVRRSARRDVSAQGCGHTGRNEKQSLWCQLKKKNNIEGVSVSFKPA